MDLECPYCEKWLDINHDDGFGYEEGITNKMECEHCGKSFVFTTSIIFYYEPQKADCLNNGEHNYQLSNTSPKEFSTMRCTMCDIERDMTDDEILKFKIGTKKNYMDSLIVNNKGVSFCNCKFPKRYAKDNSICKKCKRKINMISLPICIQLYKSTS